MIAFLPLVCRGDAKKIKEFFDNPESELPMDLKSFLNSRDEAGKSLLDFAAMLGRTDAIRTLIEYSADPNLATKRGYTALHRAAAWGHIECVKLLVEQGTDMQICNIHGERPRDIASRYDQHNCVDYLDRAEAIVALQEAIQNVKSILTDPEKNLGRLTRDDKSTANKLCLEKNDWLISNKETASVEALEKNKNELKVAMEQIMFKLQDLDIDK